MRFLSVCSGIEAASVAWSPLGWKAVAFSEIEPFPCALLAHHYPGVPNLGDMTKFQEWPDLAVDLLCGGTPCQSFSVAGLRKGLDDPRGNLMLTFGAIAARYRPRWLVWENVPGVLSSNGGRDFGSFLGMLGQLGYGFAYRVLDAQFFGVAQRRRRVFVVGCLGDWRSAAAVLFERHSLQGHPAPSRETGQRAAGAVVARAGRNGGASNQDVDGGALVAHSLRGEGFDASEDGPGRGTPLVPVAFAATDYEQGAFDEVDQAAPLTTSADRTRAAPILAFSAKDYGADAQEDLSPTLRAGGHANSHANAGVMPAIAFDTYNQVETGDVTQTLCSRGDSPGGNAHLVPAVAFQERGREDGRSLEVGGEVAYALTAPKDGGRAQERNVLTPTMQVRRLTPVECARLQGFPDTYLDITYRGKPAADGPKYKALGNSWAVPNVRWIGRRIALVDTIRARTEVIAA